MTTVVVLSDSHNRLTPSGDALELFDRCDLIFHLGDGDCDVDLLRALYRDKLYCVRGNCDANATTPEDLTIGVEGVTFFLTHGHRYGVKTSLENLRAEGRVRGVDCCLYGHTHVAAIDEGQPRAICPGSWLNKQYCYLCVNGGKIFAKNVTRNTL